MKHFRLLFLTVVLSAVCATASAQRVTLDMQNAKLEKVLGQITQQTGLVFNYTRPTINPDKRVSVSVKQAELESVLRQLFDADGIVYEIKDGKVYLADRKGGVNPPPALSAARQRYAGRIVDAAGNPVVGASVVIRGSTTGVSSDIDGRFAIEAREGEVLSVSFVGYTPQTITLGAKTMLTLTLREDTSELEEVVVVGYGTQRRSLVTSAISKVQMNESNMRQVASPTQLLSGRVAGVTTSTGSGNLGSGERMVIRGSSSLSAGNEPLYVIDGIPITNTNANLVDFGEDMSSLATLNISDIESIEVLKDAASAAIYGSRANNGVIVITTKSGKEGKSEVHLNFNTGVTRFANVGKIKMADSGLYVRDFNEGVDNYNRQYGYKPGDSGFKKHIQNPFGTLPDTDWMDLILQTGTFYNGDVSFSGGNVKTRYYVGANYNHQTGVIRTNKMEKMNFKVKISHEFTPWLEVGANVSGNYIKNHQIPGANSGTTIIGRSIQQRPFDRPYKPNGDYYVGGTDELVFHNPMQILDEETAYIENMRYLGNFYATFKYKDKFAFKSSVNTDITQIYDYTYYNENHPYGKGVGRIVDYNRTIKNILVENFATYNDKFGDFSLSAMLGHSFQKVTTRSAKLDGSGFPSPSFDVVGVASSLDAYSGSLSNYAMESYFGRATFSYKDRYVLTATLRTDGSSKFARDNRWGWFPSVSLGWNISKENFMKDSDTELKFRVSYGKTGNQEGIGSYAYQALMSGGYNYGNGSGRFDLRQPRPDVGEGRPVRRRIRHHAVQGAREHHGGRLLQEDQGPALQHADPQYDGRDEHHQQHRVDAQHRRRADDQHPFQFRSPVMAVAVQHRHQPQQAHRTAGRRQADLDRRQPCAAGRQGGRRVLPLHHGRHLPIRRRSARRAVCAGNPCRRREVARRGRQQPDQRQRPSGDRLLESLLFGRLEQHLPLQGRLARRLLYLHVRQRRLCGVEDQHLQTGTQERRAG